MYNLKVYSYPHSKEFRLYQRPIEENVKRDIEERQRWDNFVDGDGVRHSVNDKGEERTKESIDHCFNSSRNRSKQTIIEYARANDWEWFITLTFNPDKVNSFDYEECYKRVHKFFNNLKSRKAPDIKYLCVPEQHDSGRWHFHGLVSNIGDMEISESHIKGIYNISGFSYGFTTATKVKDTKRVSTYICKYITKDMADLTIGRHRYIKSNNLNKADMMDYNVDAEELEKLKQDLIAQGAHFKESKSALGGQRVIYINIDNEIGAE